MRLLQIVCFFSFFGIPNYYSQNKKEQIAALNFSLDSLKNVHLVAISMLEDSLNREREQKIKLQLISDKQLIEIESLHTKSKNIEYQVDTLTKVNAQQKKDIENLKFKIQEIKNNEIKSFTTLKKNSNLFLIDYFEKTLLKYPKLESNGNNLAKSHSVLTECEVWFQGEILYALVVVKDNNKVKTEFEGETGVFPEISLNYYILKSTNGEFVKEFSWTEKVDICPVDVDNNNIDFQITDLNKDGKLEIWCVNENYCLGGVDPKNLNVYMCEKGLLYKMKSVTNIPKMEITDIEIKEWINDGDTNYCINKFDENFKTISDEFRQYAIKMRTKNILGSDRFNSVLE